MPRNDTAPIHTFQPQPGIPLARARCQFCGLRSLGHTRAGLFPTNERKPDGQTIKERAEFLAYEIQHDIMAGEQEIANAIEVEIRRFLS